MREDGPPLEALTRRLSECPPEFLEEPRVRSAGTVHVAAVVSDLMRDLGGDPLLPEEAEAFRTDDTPRQRNWQKVVLVATWLFHDEWFRSRGGCAPQARSFLLRELQEVAPLVKASQLVTDPDRREELARLSLKALDLRPAGESAAQAHDRLTTLSSVERERVIREARAAEARARQVREAMARKAAEEAAARYSRE